MKWLGILFCGASLALVTSSRSAASDWLGIEDYGKLNVVVAKGATAPEILAAEEFAKYWRLCTGHAVSISPNPSDGVNIYIGRDALPAKYVQRVDWDAMGTDGLWLRSIQGDGHNAPSFMIAGGRERGTMYGVYEFFERYIGVRWLTPDTTFIPGPPERAASNALVRPWERRTPPSLPKVRYEYVPPYEFRRITPPDTANREGHETYVRANRISDGPGFGLWVHTLYAILPPEKYFKDHPEYYAEINGKRTAPETYDPRHPKEHADQCAQLCFTNPDVATAIVNELRERIKANPTPKVWSVSQLDLPNYCQCPECRAIDMREGTPMGSLLTCVNRVADAVKREFPDHYIMTLAYTWSRKAPKHVRPVDNVIIQLCSIECDFARPLTADFSTENAQFRRDIRDWSKIAKQLYIWDYTINFNGYQRPHPNFQVLAANERFFVKNKAKGIYEQGLGAPRLEQGYLRPYLLTKITWNPRIDLKAVQDEWLDLYYHEAAPYIREYLKLAEETVLSKNWMMSTFDPGGWMDYEFIEKARRLFVQARNAAQTDEIRNRLDFAEVPIELAAVECAPRISVEGNTMRLERPKRLSNSEYIALAKKFGISQYAEKEPIDAYGTWPHRLSSGVSEAKLETLENDRYLIWVAPALEGSVMRWHDKQTNTELLQAFRNYGRGPGTWQDWTNTPLFLEGPVAAMYTVESRSPESLTLKAVRQDGLVVHRTMTLPPASDRVEMTLTISNPTDKTLAPNVKIHPEFFTQGEDIPEIWGRKNETWQRIDQTELDPTQAAGKYLSPEGFSGLAFRVPKKRLTVTCEFDSAPLGGLLWFYNSASVAQHVNLELLPKDIPLPPGASTTIAGSYKVTAKSPATQ